MNMRSQPQQRICKSDNKDDLFTPEVREEIDNWISKYPSEWRQSAVMGALIVVQEHNGGNLTPDLMDRVAEYLDMPPVSVYEVATFYTMYEHKPVGRHKICLCSSISCMIGGSDQIRDHIKSKLDIDFGEVTKDGKFSIKEVECLGACGGAPMMQIGHSYYENLSIDSVDKILDGLE
tara:strand:- start:14615 stop:15145 length:531 start_codon:yes stop_codon:yes gene_type:complete